MGFDRILQPGRNCWRLEKADQVAFLIDGQAYFSALNDGLVQARRTMFMLTWDIYSSLCLSPEDAERPEAACPPLRDLLNEQAARHPDLQIFLMNWDFSLLLGRGREWLLRYKLGWSTHERVHFRLDDQFPLGASHHEKIAVIDDGLAFVGGLDPARGRWDTPAHRVDDPRRIAADGLGGRPHHDVQMMVGGPVATALGELVRERWNRAVQNEPTPREPPPVRAPPAIFWPGHVKPDLMDVQVAIARTRPAYMDQIEVREVEQLYLDSIAAARASIYLENQYLTSDKVACALAERLQAADGPEVIILLPRQTDGWLSQNSMDRMRIRILLNLRQADHHGRLGVYYADIPGLDETQSIRLHSKVMVIDDRFVRVGSSNLNNRSMGLDTECDLAVELTPEEALAQPGIRAFRNRLLAEHLDTTPERVAATIEAQGSLLRGIESLRTDRRSLRPLEPELPPYDESWLTRQEICDPERPIDSESLLKELFPTPGQTHSKSRWIAGAGAVVVLLGLTAAWRFTPLGEWLEPQQLRTTLESVRQLPFAPALLVGFFVLASLLMVPVTALIVATILVFGPVAGFAYALAGTLLSALVGYGLGVWTGGRTHWPLTGGRTEAIADRIARNGLLAVATVRIVPVAPFAVINLVAGSSRIRLRDYMLGTLIGMGPGIAALAFFTDRLWASLRDPDAGTVATLVVSTLVVVGLLFGLNRWARGAQNSGDLADR
ncbi:MAG: VTT domain-containing protein [Candidatus Macondimonas sp.]